MEIGQQTAGSALTGRVSVVAAAGLFGTSAVAVELLAPGLPATTTAGWRILLGGAALVLLSALRGSAPWQYQLRWPTIASGAGGFLIFQLGYFHAVGQVGVATATILTIGTGPVVAGLLDRFRYGNELRSRWWCGVLAATAGVALMTGAGNMQVDLLGWGSAIAAGCSFPVFGAAIRDLTADRPALTAVATVFGAAIVPAVLLLLMLGSNPVTDLGAATAVLYLGLVSTAIAYAFWSTGLARLSLGDTVTLTMVEPIAATALAVAVLHQSLSMKMVAGVGIALLGVWLAST